MTMLLTPVYTRTYTSKSMQPRLVRFAANPEPAAVEAKDPKAEKTDAAKRKADENSRSYHLRRGVVNTLKVPVLPIALYYGLDATGVTDVLAQNGEAWERILGEGFGHAGMCFSIHYVINAVKSFAKAITLGRFSNN